MAPHAPVTRATIWLSRHCRCIYRNLSLEDWIFRRHTFADQDGLLIWRNRPAVVIGRHQNPWVEANVPFANNNSIDVARRQSGGGAVYHDLGNVNICVFTNKARHDRIANMHLLAKVLKDKFNVNAEVSKRHDLFLDGKYKISGTAAKLAYDKAYHHFTLMLNVDVSTLWSVLSPSMPGISSKATASTRSDVKTLTDASKDIQYEYVVRAIVDEFRSRYQTSDVIEVDSITDSQFENVEKTVREFSSWQWIYGMTPPFSVCYTLARGTVTASLHVEKGILVKCTVQRNNGEGNERSDIEEILNRSGYIGCRYSPELSNQIFDWLHSLNV